MQRACIYSDWFVEHDVYFAAFRNSKWTDFK